MKDRTTLGHCADTAETAARTVADSRATERIIEACDWQFVRKKEKNRIDSILRRLNASDRAFARAVLSGKSWKEMGVPKTTFSDTLKKVEKLISCP